MKLIAVTWSYDDSFDYENTRLYKSFIKKNDKKNFLNIHYNRNHYKELESQFESRFGYQYEFLLYRIYLLKDSLKKLRHKTIIFADTSDVACLDNIDNINLTRENKIVFGSERHRYPNEVSITNWQPNYMYNEIDRQRVSFLNAGLSIGNRKKFIELYEYCVENIFDKNYRNFGGDQGVFTYYYLNTENGLIELDYKNEFFINTYTLAPYHYSVTDGRLFDPNHNTKPIFLHDNGWNYGSPKFIEYFNLI